MIKVVQFSITPLAGAPIRVAKAINLLEDIEIRHVDLYKNNIFEQDVIFRENKEEAIQLSEDADIIHIYNYINLETKDFYPIDFKELKRKGKKIIQHFQSTPMLIANKIGTTANFVVNYPLPQIVIAQYPERFFPNAKVIPNIVPQDDPLYRATKTNQDIDLIFTPSWDRSAWETRWDTKGLPETKIILNRLNNKYNYSTKIFRGIPLHQVMTLKNRSKLILDETVTGSYHLSSLEGLSLGKPVLTYLDKRTEKVLKYISGCNEIPFINTKLEELELVAKALLDDDDTRNHIGDDSRRWIETFWKDKNLALQFKKIYEDLLDNPELVTRQKYLSLTGPKEIFFSISMPNIIWEARKRKSFSLKIFLTYTLIRVFKNHIKRILSVKFLRNFKKQLR